MFRIQTLRGAIVCGFLLVSGVGLLFYFLRAAPKNASGGWCGSTSPTVLQREYDSKIDEWRSLDFAPLTSDTEISSAVSEIQVNKKVAVVDPQLAKLRDTVCEYLKVNCDWDAKGFVKLCLRRDMVLRPEGVAMLKKVADDYSRLTGVKSTLPEDPTEMFYYVTSGKYLEDLLRASGGKKDETEIKKFVSAFSTGRAPVACAKSKSVMTVAARREDLPYPARILPPLFRGPREGTTSVVFLYQSKIFPTELDRRGGKTIWAEVDIILKHKHPHGNAVPHSIILFWNNEVQDWMLDIAIAHYPAYIYALMG